MKNLLKILLLLSVGLVVLALIAGTTFWHGLAGQPGISVSINGEELDLQGLGAAVPWFGAVLGLFVAGLVMCVVVPLLLLLGLGLPLLIVGVVFGSVLLGVFGIGTLLFSPLILLVLVLWLILRRRPKANITA
jgi:hypothetical protein